MNYRKTIQDFENGELIFSDNFDLNHYTPNAKKIKILPSTTSDIAAKVVDNAECQTEHDDGNVDELMREMHRLIPDVCEFLSKQEPLHKERFVQLLVLRATGEFPTSNICYSLFMDVVHALSSTTFCDSVTYCIFICIAFVYCMNNYIELSYYSMEIGALVW